MMISFDEYVERSKEWEDFELVSITQEHANGKIYRRAEWKCTRLGLDWARWYATEIGKFVVTSTNYRCEL